MKRTEARNIGQIINDLLKKENLDDTPSSAMSRTV